MQYLADISVFNSIQERQNINFMLNTIDPFAYDNVLFNNRIVIDNFLGKNQGLNAFLKFVGPIARIAVNQVIQNLCGTPGLFFKNDVEDAAEILTNAKTFSAFIKKHYAKPMLSRAWDVAKNKIKNQKESNANENNDNDANRTHISDKLLNWLHKLEPHEKDIKGKDILYNLFASTFGDMFTRYAQDAYNDLKPKLEKILKNKLQNSSQSHSDNH